MVKIFWIIFFVAGTGVAHGGKLLSSEVRLATEGGIEDNSLDEPVGEADMRRIVYLKAGPSNMNTNDIMLSSSKISPIATQTRQKLSTLFQLFCYLLRLLLSVTTCLYIYPEVSRMRSSFK